MRSSQAGLRELACTAQPDETLWAIARRYGVAWKALAGTNRIRDARRVRVGRRLVIMGAKVVPDGQEPPPPAELALGPPPAT